MTTKHAAAAEHVAAAVVDEQETGSAPAETPETATPAEATAEATAEAEQLAAARAAQQFNTHDVKVLAQQIDKLLLALQALGYTIDQGRVKAAADAQAACEILVAYGLATETEVQARAYLAARSILAQALQQAEEATLRAQQQARAVQPIRQGPIVVARQ